MAGRSMASTTVIHSPHSDAAAVARVNLKALLESHLVEHPLETLFHGCVKRVLIPDRSSQPDLLDTLRNLFSTTQQETLPLYMDQYMTFLSSQTNHQRAVYLLGLLAKLTSNNILKPRLVCEVILKHLDINNEMVWSESLKAVKGIVGGIDYKGCRDLMKSLFDKFDSLGRDVPEQQLPALLNAQELLSYILDRNASLLPAYFAHDEIHRHYKNHIPHWILQEVIGKLQTSMRATADMVSGIVLQYLMPVQGVSNVSGSVWRLDPTKHCYVLKGQLPYKEALMKAQEDLLYHVIAQPNSRDVVHSLLGMNRQQPQLNLMVEDALVRLGVVAMEMSEGLSVEDQRVFEFWSHFASQLVFFYFLQLVNVVSVLTKLRIKLSRCRYHKGRSWLMWCLLHFLTSTVQSKASQVATQKEFVQILNLFSLLYQDKEPLEVPNVKNPSCIFESSMASMWVIYANKVHSEELELPCPMPHNLSKQVEWVQRGSENPPPLSSLPKDYTIPLLLNVYSNNLEISNQLLGILLEAMVAPGPNATPTPLPLHALNTLTMHAKIRLMEKVKVHLVKVAEAVKHPLGPDTPTITHALLETYSRLLVWLGTRNFQTQLIPAVFKSQAWGVLHALLELISYRVHLQLQYSYRFQLLQQLHTVASVTIIPNQLFVTAESATLRVIRGLNSPEFLIQLAKQFAPDPKPLLSTESEELNRVFVLMLAQAMHISNLDTVNWLDPFLRAVFSYAPYSWPERTLSFFPTALRQLCSIPSLAEYRTTLVSKVEEEYKKYKSKTSEAELIQIFTDTDSTAVFLCVLWKLLMDSGGISSVCIRIAQLITAQPKKLKLAALMRKLVDYIIFSISPGIPVNQHNLIIQRLNELVWKYNFFPLDRLILCMVMRSYESREAQCCLSLIQTLLLGYQGLSQRISTLAQEVPADYWNQPQWDKKHSDYLNQFPERFEPEAVGIGSPSKIKTLPMYFGSLCLRLLPVMDLVIQRMLEMQEATSHSLEKLLDHLGVLYKFHDHPLSFLYSTMHYYERTFAEKPALKKKLVSTVLGAQKSVHPFDWYFTPEFCEYLSVEKPSWAPTRHYYSESIERLVKGLRPFCPTAPGFDWHFSEFSGPLAFTLHCTLVEFLSLPLHGKTLARELMDTIYDKAATSDESEILSWINAIGLVFVLLPDSYSSSLLEEVLQMLRNSLSSFSRLHQLAGGNQPGCLLSILHAYWHHSNMGVLLGMPQWLQTSVRPLVKNEAQLLFICHLLGPLLQRLTSEKPKALLEVVMEIYYLVQSVDKQLGGQIQHSDIICDFLYHIKYMHIGDKMREDIERVVYSLHPPLKLRLRFLVPPPMERPPQQPTTAPSLENMQL